MFHTILMVRLNVWLIHWWIESQGNLNIADTVYKNYNKLIAWLSTWFIDWLTDIIVERVSECLILEMTEMSLKVTACTEA